ncbi:complement C1q tumor necrosis factor-related protein 4 [Girardinichthys multiradiatus]|uniref:complement C1q tumor necrosis factor-related protein 4 n=1 Tax=Girardinichthys multiradiatus TaxID=208333 RepID=UPI001FAD0F45|nr:complement C1q tumor necrosis factor-related protein 4 [Girardinichthys multiradiatus]
MQQLCQLTSAASWRSRSHLACFVIVILYSGGASSLYGPAVATGLGSAFSAAQTNSVVGGKQKALTFNKLLVNIGRDFNPDTGYFRCRIPGAYYFSFSVGKFPKKLLSVILVKNSEEVQAIAFDDYHRKGRKVQSQSVMISLKEMDTVWLLLQQNPRYAVYSNAGPYITFSGYLVYPKLQPASYEGNHLLPPALSYPVCPPQAHSQSRGQGMEQPQSAFSVARTSTLVGKRSRHQIQPPLNFDVEFVNIGGHFNKTSGLFTCHFPGVYFFAFTVGKHPKKAISVKLMTGSGQVQAMVFDEDMSKRREMQSQSLMLQLDRGELVWLYSQQDQRYAVYSNHGRYTTFSGFLVYPTAETTPNRPPL